MPARGGSKRIPGKNKRMLAGKELVRYAIEAALASTEITHVALTSDDADILEIGRAYEALTCIDRPAHISGDEALAITYVRHCLEVVAESYDFVVIVQPSSPFTTPEDIDQTIRLAYQEDADSAVSVVKLDHAIHPAKLKRMEGNQLLPYYEAEDGRMATHELPELYVRNGSVYVSSIDVIQQGQIIGERCFGHVMPRERSIDINDPIDLSFSAYLLSQRNHE